MLVPCLAGGIFVHSSRAEGDEFLQSGSLGSLCTSSHQQLAAVRHRTTHALHPPRYPTANPIGDALGGSELFSVSYLV